MAETLDYDIEGLYNALRTGEGGLPKRSEREALNVIKDDVLGQLETTMGMSPEDVSYFKKNKTPEQIIEQFTTTKSRGGSLGAFAEGALTEGISTRLSFPLAIKAGVAASNIVPLPFAATPVGLGIKGTIGVLTGGAAYLGADKVIKDVILDTVADVAGLPGPKDERLPSERAAYESGRTFGGIVGGGQALRGYLKKIPEEGIDIVFKNINPIKEKLRSGFKSLSSKMRKFSEEKSSKKFIPDPYTRADIAAAGGAAALVNVAEEANPGGTWSRIGAEIVGSLLPATLPFAQTIKNIGVDKLKNIGLAYVPETDNKLIPKVIREGIKTAKQRQAGNYIVKKLRESATDAGEEFDVEKFLDNLILEDKRLKELGESSIFSPGFVTQNEPLIALEKMFSQQDPVFAKKLSEQGKERSIALLSTMKAIEDTGELNAITLAAETYGKRFANLIEARFNSAVKAVDDAVGPFETIDPIAAANAREQGSKIFADNLREIEDGADKTIDALWNNVSSKTKVFPTNTLKVYEEAIEPESGYIDLPIFTTGKNKIDLGKNSDRFFRIINNYKSLERQSRFLEKQPRFLDTPRKPMIFNKMKNQKRQVQQLAKNESDPSVKMLYTQIQKAMLQDMNDALIDPSDLIPFTRAREATRAKNDIFEKVFVSNFNKSDSSGRLVSTPIQTITKLFTDRGDNAFQFMNDINTAVRIFSQESLKGVPVEGVNVKKLQKTGEKGLENLFGDFLPDLLIKRGVIKPVKTVNLLDNISPTDLKPLDPKKTKETFVVDQNNLNNFLDEPAIKQFFDLPSLAPLRQDLLDAKTASFLLKRNLAYFQRISRQQGADLDVLKKMFKFENPENVIRETINSNKPLESVDRLFKIVNRGITRKQREGAEFNPEKIKKAFLNNVISYLVNKAQPNVDNMNTISFEELLDAPINQLQDAGKKALTKTGSQTSLRDKLKQYGFFPKDYQQKLKLVLDDYRKIENYVLKMYGPEQGMSKDEAVDFFARFTGARLAPGGTIQVPAQFAKVFSRTLEEVPRTLLASKLKTALQPGNIDVFIETIRAAGPDAGKTATQYLLENFLGYIKAGAVTATTSPVRETELPFLKNKTSIRVPPKKPPPKKPPEKKVSEANIPPRPTITAPPAQEVAQANLGPFNPETLARMEQLDRLVG
tara:strand:+ start:1655 stop:5140 length:3486 start_codon:yes stop_codon:yes gene_type:complete